MSTAGGPPAFPGPPQRSAQTPEAPHVPPLATGGVAGLTDAQLYLHPQTLARLGSLELRAKMIVEGVMSGAHRSPYKGVSVEFAQHRPYAPGDDLRRLDWKVFGRTDKLQVKQYQQETNLDLVVLVDSSASMRFGSRSFREASGVGRPTAPDGRPNWSKYDHATAVAAAMAYICLRQGDRVGLVVFADEVRRVLRQSSSHGTWRAVVGALSLSPIERPTDLARAVDQTLAKLTGRCLIAIISDLLEPPERIRAALSRIHFRGHDCLIAHVLDRQEETFDLGPEAPLIGLEGEPLVRVDPRALRDAYLQALDAHVASIQRDARGMGFDYMRVSTHQWLGPTLSAFLAARQARLRRAKSG
ncbi:MAG: DUF58 domain-containing protein [Planctomyces sp.]|nr:DUF58 domain-containing protein [Planctomyces sp.]MBA4039993.1 DUF58 domain-containing protein [Planctomyces sp.]